MPSICAVAAVGLTFESGRVPTLGWPISANSVGEVRLYGRPTKGVERRSRKLAGFTPMAFQFPRLRCTYVSVVLLPCVVGLRKVNRMAKGKRGNSEGSIYRM